MEMHETINKIARIKELALEIPKMSDQILLNDYIIKSGINDLPDDILFRKYNQVKIILLEIKYSDINDIRLILEKSVSSKAKIKILGPSFIKEPFLLWNDSYNQDIPYDIIIQGNAIEMWAINMLYHGMWFEEYLAFTYDSKNPDIDKNLVIKSWNQDKFIPKEIKDKVRELKELTGKCAVHLPIIPVEMEFNIRRRINTDSIRMFKVDVYKSLNINDMISNSINSYKDKEDFFNMLIKLITIIGNNPKLEIDRDGYFIANNELQLYKKTVGHLSPSSKINQWLQIYFNFVN